jgi:hypothetical protein
VLVAFEGGKFGAIQVLAHAYACRLYPCSSQRPLIPSGCICLRP